MSWINTYKNWRSAVIRHYGSVENFDNARTIRIHLENAEKSIASDLRILASLDGKLEPDDTGFDFLRDDVEETKRIKEELLSWLSDRRLKP